MIKKDSRGFTVIELLVAICILTTVIFIGYKIINKSTKTIKYQNNISQSQLIINNMNKFLTDDLEQSEYIILEDNTNLPSVKYENTNQEKDFFKNALDKILLENKDKSVIEYRYIINIKGKMNNRNYIVKIESNKYSISREVENESEIEFIYESKVENNRDTIKAPFVINGNNPYNVEISYEESDNKLNYYDFEIMSRYSIANDDEIDKLPEEDDELLPPEIDKIIPPGYDTYESIGFWAANPDIQKEDNLYTWINTNNTNNPGDFGKQINTTYREYDIKAELEPWNASKEYAHTGCKNDGHAKTDDCSYIDEGPRPKMYLNKMSIYISPKASVKNFKISSKDSSLSIKLNGSNILNIPIELSGGLNGTWYEFEVESKNAKINDLNIIGNLVIDQGNSDSVNKGHAIIVFGTDRGSSVGDIILECIEEDNGYWRRKIINNMYEDESRINQHSDHKGEEYQVNFSLFLANDSQQTIRARLDGVSEMVINNLEVQDINKVTVQFEGDVEIEDIESHDSNVNVSYNPVINTYTIEFIKKGQYNINGKNVKIKSNSSDLTSHRIIMNFE